MNLFSACVGQGVSSNLEKFSNNPKEFNNKVDLIRYGVSIGLTFIDTAESYGNGVSEEIIGIATKNIRNKVKIASKFSPENSRYQSVIDSAEKSLRRLGTDYIDLYQIHWPNPKVELAETMTALMELKTCGKIQNIGVCNFSTTQLSQAIKIVGEGEIVSNQVEYNIFDRFIERDILPYCESKKIKIIAYSPLDKGRIPSDKIQIEKLRLISQVYDLTIHQLILNWLLSNPNVIAIPASNSKINLKANADSLKKTVSKDHLDVISSFRAEEQMIKPCMINVSEFGEDNRKVYKTLLEAQENKLNLCPSPEELAEEIKLDSNIKPVRLIPSVKDDPGFDFDLVEGRVRYWAWVMAFGFYEPIPAYVRRP
jgi:myo-inositol catabolism protein IolS